MSRLSTVKVLTLEVKRLQHGAEIGARSEKILAELRKAHIDVKKELATEKAKMARLRDGFLGKLLLRRINVHDASNFIDACHEDDDNAEDSILGRRIR